MHRSTDADTGINDGGTRNNYGMGWSGDEQEQHWWDDQGLINKTDMNRSTDSDIFGINDGGIRQVTGMGWSGASWPIQWLLSFVVYFC